MKIAILQSPRQFTMGEAPKPVPAADEVLIKVSACGVCTSDMEAWTGGQNQNYPRFLGHEVSGVVEETGASVTRFHPGDPVACWVYSHGYAEYVTARELFVFSAGTLALDLAMAEPLSCAVNAVEMTHMALSDDVVIIGAGFMGGLVQKLVQLKGPRHLIVADTRPDALERAARMGATCTVNVLEQNLPEVVKSLTDGKGADLSFEVTGSQAPLTNVGRCHPHEREGGSGRFPYVGYAPDPPGLLELDGLPDFQRALPRRSDDCEWNAGRNAPADLGPAGYQRTGDPPVPAGAGRSRPSDRGRQTRWFCQIGDHPFNFPSGHRKMPGSSGSGDCLCPKPQNPGPKFPVTPENFHTSPARVWDPAFLVPERRTGPRRNALPAPGISARKACRGLSSTGAMAWRCPISARTTWTASSFAVEEAKKLGLETWIYDEMNWPCGTADKRVLQARPDLAQRYIECLNFTVRGPWFTYLTGADSRYIDFERSTPVAAFAISLEGASAGKVIDLTPNLSFENVIPWEAPDGQLAVDVHRRERSRLLHRCPEPGIDAGIPAGWATNPTPRRSKEASLQPDAGFLHR